MDSIKAGERIARGERMQIYSGTAFLTLLILIGFSQPADSCSVLAAATADGMRMAKNFDWRDGQGHLLFTPALNGTKYASLSFHLDSVSGDRPMGGINSAGLAIEVVWLANSQFPSADENKIQLDDLRFIRASLDQTGSTAELIQFLDRVSLTKYREPLQFIACDLIKCAVMESILGRWTIYQDESLPKAVLTNISYGRAREVMKGYKEFGGNRFSQGHYPSARFARATAFLEKFAQPSIEDFWSALISLSVPAGPFKTQWSYIYELGPQTISLLKKNGVVEKVSLPKLQKNLINPPKF